MNCQAANARGGEWWWILWFQKVFDAVTISDQIVKEFACAITYRPAINDASTLCFYSTACFSQKGEKGPIIQTTEIHVHHGMPLYRFFNLIKMNVSFYKTAHFVNGIIFKASAHYLFPPHCFYVLLFYVFTIVAVRFLLYLLLLELLYLLLLIIQFYFFHSPTSSFRSCTCFRFWSRSCPRSCPRIVKLLCYPCSSQCCCYRGFSSWSSSGFLFFFFSFSFSPNHHLLFFFSSRKGERKYLYNYLLQPCDMKTCFFFNS